MKMFNRVFLLLVASFIFLGVIGNSLPASAVSGSEWRAGRIIDDPVFFDYTSMDVATIQRFLDSKTPTCERNRPEYFNYAGKPYGPPWTCLREYQEHP